MDAPLPTTVIALSLPQTGAPPGANARSAFDQMVATIIRDLGFTLQDPGGFTITTVLAPDMALPSALRLLAAAVATFESRCPPLRVRGLLHHGVVFRQETAGVVTYLGSAIRSANSILSRVTAMGGVYATQDFRDNAAKLGALPIALDARNSSGSPDPLVDVRFLEKAGPAKSGGQLMSSDDKFLEFLKKRLAVELGPFAGPLVDNANRTLTSARELAHAVAHEVDNPESRQKFEAEVLAYIKSRSS